MEKCVNCGHDCHCEEDTCKECHNDVCANCQHEPALDDMPADTQS